MSSLSASRGHTHPSHHATNPEIVPAAATGTVSIDDLGSKVMGSDTPRPSHYLFASKGRL